MALSKRAISLGMLVMARRLQHSALADRTLVAAVAGWGLSLTDRRRHLQRGGQPRRRRR